MKKTKLRGWMRGFVAFLIGGGLAGADEPFIPSDSLFGQQWGLCNVGQEVGGVAGQPGADMHLPEAWAVHRGTSSVVVAVIGTGVDPHPEFADRLLEGCGIAGDPYNSLDQGPTGPKGTHVAGIIAAASNNGSGIAGIHGAVRILPVRVTDDGTTTDLSAANGITWAVDHGADIIVVPLQFYNYRQQLEDAVAHAAANDVLVIAPAGGEGGPPVAYPARFNGCLAVAATTNLDAIAEFSSDGPEVDLAAPGQNILSTWRDGGYEYLEEAYTSAAAHAAGVAALVLSYAPQLSAPELVDVLTSSADDLGTPGLDTHFGWGRINAYQALQAAPAPPLRFEQVEPFPAQVLPNAATVLTIRIASVAQALVPGSARLFYRLPPAAGFNSIQMTALGGDLFTVELPAAPCDAVIEYYLFAVGNQRTVVTEPLDAPSHVHTALAIQRVPLLIDDFESDLGWETSVEGTCTSCGQWDRVIPVATSAQPGFDYSPDAKTHAYITGQHTGPNDGSNDVDGGPVRLFSPIIPIVAYDIEIGYARWFHCSGTGAADELSVEFSRDAGATWTVAETVTATDGWQPHGFRLSEFPDVTGDQLRVRFSVTDAAPPSLTEAAIDEFHVHALHCAPPKGDFDGDGHIGLVDFAELCGCLAGPAFLYNDGGCGTFDFEDDNDVDLVDIQAFQRSYNP